MLQFKGRSGRSEPIDVITRTEIVERILARLRLPRAPMRLTDGVSELSRLGRTQSGVASNGLGPIVTLWIDTVPPYAVYYAKEAYASTHVEDQNTQAPNSPGLRENADTKGTHTCSSVEVPRFKEG